MKSLLLVLACASATVASSTQGIVDLVQRRLPDHVNAFAFILQNSSVVANASGIARNDEYTVSCKNGKVVVEGNSPIALATG